MRTSEKRYKMLCVPLETILDLLIPVSDYSAIRKIKLPEDVRPISVYWDTEYQEFRIVIESKEFDPVENHAKYPTINFEDDMIKAVPVCRLEETKVCIDNDVTRIWIDTPSAVNIEYARQILSKIGFGTTFEIPENFKIVTKTKEDK